MSIDLITLDRLEASLVKNKEETNRKCQKNNSRRVWIPLEDRNREFDQMLTLVRGFREAITAR